MTEEGGGWATQAGRQRCWTTCVHRVTAGERGRVSPPTMPGTGVTWGTGRTTGNTDGVGGRVIMARQV